MSDAHGGSPYPPELMASLAAAPKALAAWDGLTSIGRRDFTSWINEAKQAETRRRRIERCVENLMKGKKLPCCYAVVPMDFYKALGEDPAAKAQWRLLDANGKRDITDWIESSADKVERKERVARACANLAVGKTRAR